MIDKIQSTDRSTHMPFLTIGENSLRTMLYCSAGQREPGHAMFWKLWAMTNGDDARRIDTGLSREMPECSPSGWYDDTGWHVTFIAGGKEGDRLFRLYRMDGPSLDSLQLPYAICATISGFVYRDRLAFVRNKSEVCIRQPQGDIDFSFEGKSIRKLSYRADKPDLLLITLQDMTTGDIVAMDHDLKTGERHVITCDGKPAYKCTVLGKDVLHVVGSGDDHRIVEAVSVSRVLIEG